MNVERNSVVQMIPLEKIEVVNPRERGSKKFEQIVNNIAHLGLKKPITVTPKHADAPDGHFYLVCGQGRLEAYQTLGQTEIPAIVVRTTREQLYLMSLVENLARRQHCSLELMREIDALRQRHYSFAEIARKTDLDVSYVRGILKLLHQGEERLLQAVEQGQIPLSVAITISCSDDQQVQRALTEAYEANSLRGSKLLAARKLIETRRAAGKRLRGRVQLKSAAMESGQNLLKAYRDETTRQRIAIQKAKLCETRLLFALSALRRLLRDPQLVSLLQSEGLDSIPAFLSDRMCDKEPSQC